MLFDGCDDDGSGFPNVCVCMDFEEGRKRVEI
jgi:hypothetical protein